MMMADLGRNMRDQIENDDDNDKVADSGTGETLAMEREFFAMAQDMNEVLISAVHDAAARGIFKIQNLFLNFFFIFSKFQF